MNALSIRDLELEARRRLPRETYDYFAGGADDETTLRENEAAFRRIGIVPRVLRGAEARDLGVQLLGARASIPVLLAPTAFHRLAHSDGEHATARAAARAGTILIASMASTVAIEELAAAFREGANPDTPSPWFQLTIQSDLAFTELIVRRAEASGCTAIVVSVDSPVFGRRERDLRNGFIELPDGLCCENLREPLGGGAYGRAREIEFWPGLGWESIDWLRATTALPIVLKGIVHPADARLAVARGVDAIIVSNHGGRQLDAIPASIDLLPAIADAVAGDVPLLVDGGIRRGTDVVKALARGASAVAVGRPVLWGLAAGGEAGVSQVLETFRSELDTALALCGCAALTEVCADLLYPRAMACAC